MSIYVVNGDKVAARAAAPAKVSKGSLIISSADDIEASDLPASRLVSIWNALPGVAPITKFKDRKAAARRLWAAFQNNPATSGPKLTRAEKPSATASKQAQIVEMLKRDGGATIVEIIEVTAWQPHTVRGAISGTLRKKLGLNIISEKAARGRVYRIAG